MPAATAETAPQRPLKTQSSAAGSGIVLALLTAAVVLVHGYHPFADDAGIYIAGVRKLLNPALYPIASGFVTAHTHLSLFAHAVAAGARLTHLPLATLLFALYVFSIVLFLVACQRLAIALSPSAAAQRAALLLAAACFTLPIAGTGLFLMDPYLTARSFSTPLSLFAVEACLRRRAALTLLYLAAALLLHPLMGCFAAAFVLLQVLLDAGRFRAVLLACGAGLAAAGAADLACRHRSADPAWLQVLNLPSHRYLFSARWTWYEIAGLVLPLLLLGLAAHRSQHRSARILARTCVATGVTAFGIAVLLVRPAGPYILVPLQLLRAFHLIYAVGILLLGVWLGSRRTRHRWPPFAVAASVALALFAAQRSDFPDSQHLEWPGRAPSNPWQQAFLWIRSHTPPDAVFAVPPRLVYLPGEDAQGFRAMAERSQLADDKDAGVAVVFPALAPEWGRERNAAAGLTRLTDAERWQILHPLGATWLLIPSGTPTGFPCLYRNAAVLVCHMRQPPV